MGKKLFIHTLSREVRVALLEDDTLIEFFIERSSDQRMVGNIYKGKIENVLPGMQAAFVDIGQDKNAFLFVDEILPSQGLRKDGGQASYAVERLVTKGQEILVQVHKEAGGNKGPKVTTNIALPGRYLVYMPYGVHIGISRQIVEELERERLKEIGQHLVTGSEGLILRTVCEGVAEAELLADMEQLRQSWQDIVEQAKHTGATELVYQETDITPKIVRNYMTPDITACYTNSTPMYRRLKKALYRYPTLQEKVKLYDHSQDMFDYFDLTAEIDKAFRRKVWLKSGGYLIFDHTEALTVVDVNTGKFVGKQNLEQTAVHTNLEAAQEIARQLRLRDIGGIIIIDFIDMTEEEHNQSVLQCLEEIVKKDRTKTTVVGLTGLGLVELTRKKVRQSLQEIVSEPCSYCEGKGYIRGKEDIAAQIERLLLEYRHTDLEAVLLTAHPEIVATLEGVDQQGLRALENKCGFKISLYPNSTLHQETFKVLYQGSLAEVKRREQKLTASSAL